jgi:hypothetical protein
LRKKALRPYRPEVPTKPENEERVFAKRDKIYEKAIHSLRDQAGNFRNHTDFIQEMRLYDRSGFWVDAWIEFRASFFGIRNLLWHPAGIRQEKVSASERERKILKMG